MSFDAAASSAAPAPVRAAWLCASRWSWRPSDAEASESIGGGSGARAAAGAVSGLVGQALSRTSDGEARGGDFVQLDACGVGARGSAPAGAGSWQIPPSSRASADEGDAAAQRRLNARVGARSASVRPGHHARRRGRKALVRAVFSSGRDGLDADLSCGCGAQTRPILRVLHRPRQPLSQHAIAERAGGRGTSRPRSKGARHSAYPSPHASSARTV